MWHEERDGLDIPRLGEFVGLAESVSNIMSLSASPESRRTIVTGTTQIVNQLELQTDEIKEIMKDCDEKIKNRFEESLLYDDDEPDQHDWENLLADDGDFIVRFHKACNNAGVKEADGIFDPD